MNRLRNRSPFVLILLAICLTGCTGQEFVLALMAIGAASGIWHAVDKPNENDSSTDSPSESTSSGWRDQDVHIDSDVYYDGVNDDLLTAGLGQTGLNASPLKATDPSNPTASEIRQAAIVNAYHAQQDMRTSSGYGTLYGPAVPTRFSTPASDGKISGREYLAYLEDSSNFNKVTMMVQVPDEFNWTMPCLIVTASPGSFGVYGALSTVGEWGLKNHCAVAYTDRGTGNGVHDLFTDTVDLIDGTRTTAQAAGIRAHFKAQGTTQMDLASYHSTYPYRIAQQHAHSQQNPDEYDGKVLLETIQFAFQVLKKQKDAFDPNSTLVIASGTSTGGTACLHAAELDSENLIDGVVVASPFITPAYGNSIQNITLQQGEHTFFYKTYHKNILELMTYIALYQPCASAQTTAGMPGRCTALFKENLLTNPTLPEQIAEAQKRLNDYGTLETTNAIAHLYEGSDRYIGLSMLYANAYGRFSVVENLCGYSFAAIDNEGFPQAKSLIDLADDFQSSTGMPPSSGTELINNHGHDGQGITLRKSTNNEGHLDSYLQGAWCLRHLVTGTTGITPETGTALQGEEAKNYQRVQTGIGKTYATAQLRGKPTILLHGRDDALAHVNFTSRPYYALNQKIETTSQVRYIEIMHAHHFDAWNQTYQITTQVPLIYYFHQALDKMYDHLKNKVPLPKSQVIQTIPPNRLPEIAEEPPCSILFSRDTLTIPECS